MGGTRGEKGLILNNYPTSDLSDSEYTGLLIDICLLEEGGSGICGAAVAEGARFCMPSMYEFNTALNTRTKGLVEDLLEVKGGV